jgi:hypothetical protein
MSNYKGFPICQAALIRWGIAGAIHEVLKTDLDVGAHRRVERLALKQLRKCGLEKLQPVIDAVES